MAEPVRSRKTTSWAPRTKLELRDVRSSYNLTSEKTAGWRAITPETGLVYAGGADDYDPWYLSLPLDGQPGLISVRPGDVITRYGWRWQLSASGTSEYYLQTLAGGDPGIAAAPAAVIRGDAKLLPRGTPGTLSPGSWGYGTVDGGGYNTIFVRVLESVDPDTLADGELRYVPATAASSVILSSTPRYRQSRSKRRYFTREMIWTPGSGASMNVLGGSSTISGTGTTPAITTNGTFADVLWKQKFTSGAVIGNQAGVHSAVHAWRGDAQGRGGFEIEIIFSSGTAPATTTNRLFGVTGGAVPLAGTISAQNNTAGFGTDEGDTVWQVFTRDGATTTKTATGLTMAANQTFHLYLLSEPGASSMRLEVDQLGLDGLGTPVVATDLTATLPTNTIRLQAMAQLRVSVAAADNFDFHRLEMGFPY